jgi:hypothetical protein
MRLKDLIHETKLQVAVLQERLDLVDPPARTETHWNIIRSRLRSVQADLDVFSLSLELNRSPRDIRIRKTRRRRPTVSTVSGHGFNIDEWKDTSGEVQPLEPSAPPDAEPSKSGEDPLPVYHVGSGLSPNPCGDRPAHRTDSSPSRITRPRPTFNNRSCQHGAPWEDRCEQCSAAWTERLGEKPY